MSESDDPVIEESRRIDEQVFGRKTVEAFRGPSEERAAADAKRAAAAAGQMSPRATSPTSQDLVRDFTANTRKRKSKQAAAAVLTRDWLPPTLGTPGLLGIA